MSALTDSEWPAARLGEALLAFMPAARAPTAAPPSMPAAVAPDDAATHRWVETRARQLGLEALAFDTTHAELFTVLPAAGTALLRLPGSEPTFLVLLGGNRRRLVVLGADYVTRTVTREAVRARFCQEAEAQLGAEIDGLLRQGDVLHDSEQLRASLLAERLRQVRVEAGWLVRLSPQGALRPRIRQAGLGGALAGFLLAHLASHGAWILAWLTIGEDALQGRFDSGWLLAGGMLLLTFAALRVAADWLQGLLSLRVGMLLRQRLFEGALALDPQAARGEGVGQFLGRIFEAQAVEALAVSGGLSATTAVLELLTALVILAWGGDAWELAGLLLLFMAICSGLAARHLQARWRWTDKRRAITHDLIERMAGHRTRLVQEDSRHWHDQEDQALAAYSAESRRFDSTMVWLAVLPRAWLVAAALGLGWEFSSGASTHSLAIIIAAILMAFESFRNLVQGVPALAGAVTAWKEVAPLLRAAAVEPAGAAGHVVAAGHTGGHDAAPSTPRSANAAPSQVEAQQVEAQGVDFRTQTHGRLVLRDLSLNIATGDRVLLEGPSGGGKSTLATLLAGLRRPDQGVLLLNGLDLATLGEVAWRRHVALAAQFHENHVVSETFAFNLLMGRGWPPTRNDLELADTICREIGLGGLLDRMPSGLDQQVGESGWQLSHGEKSRLYLARALLQDAELVVLDESFAALDPDSLRESLKCVLKRAPSLLVVAHP